MPCEAAVKGTVKTRRFLVVWQNPESRELVEVGELRVEHASDDIRRCWFSYRSDAGAAPAFKPFLAFPDSGRTYERKGSLFPFFENRVMSARRPDFKQYADALGLTREEADPVEILARSAGTRATDTVHVVPQPAMTAEGAETRLFLVSGVRHTPDADQYINGLRKGQRLYLREQPDNPVNPRAVILDVERNEPIGWVPNHLLDYVHKHKEVGSDVHVTVEKANGPEVPSHLRVLARMTVHPAAND